MNESDINSLATAQSRRKLLMREPSGMSVTQETLTRVMLDIFKSEVFNYEAGDDSSDAEKAMKEKAEDVLSQLKQTGAQSMEVMYAGYGMHPLVALKRL